MDNEGKFSIIKELKQEKMFENYIPDFISVLPPELNNSISKFLDGSPCLLRSSLKDEAGLSVIRAGKSLTIKEIRDGADYQKAYNTISKQDNLCQVILQKQFLYSTHFTVLIDGDFFYANFTAKSECGFFVLSPLTKLGTIPEEKILRPFIELLKGRLKRGKWLLEIGVHDKDIRLFQAILVSDRLLSIVFSDDLLCKLLKENKSWQNAPTVWQLLKCEWRAFCFRQKKCFESGVSDAFSNWYFLFHYFYLFCRQNKRHGHDKDFVDFLKLAYGSKSYWQTEIISRHLKIAAKIRKQEDGPLIPAAFSSITEGVYYLGKGIHRGILGEAAVLLKELIPEVIYQISLSKIIITPSNQILGHGILAAAERNINVLANVDEKFFASLKSNDHFCIDFEKYSFVIKS